MIKEIEQAERFYNGAYTIIEILIKHCKDGFDKEKYTQAIKEIKALGDNYKEYAYYASVIFNVALIGINKEAIEKTNKHSNYDSNLVNCDVRKYIFNKELKDELLKLEKSRVKNTNYDNWLVIKKDYEKDTIIGQVRNSLLHENYIPRYKKKFSSSLEYISLGTKSYYEAELIAPNFFQFVAGYYGDYKDSIRHKLYLISINNTCEIKYSNLKSVLENINIIDIEYVPQEKNADEPYEMIINEIEKSGDTEDLLNYLGNLLKEEKIKVRIRNLTVEEQLKICVNILNHYRDDFDKKDYDIKNAIINHQVNYVVDPCNSICNAINGFILLLQKIDEDEINDKDYLEDEMDWFVNYPALIIAKAYLIDYKINGKYKKEKLFNIDYSNIDIDYSKINIYSMPETDLFEKSINKEKNKNCELCEEAVRNKVIFDIIRNSLSHSNTKLEIDEDYLSHKYNQNIIFIDEHKNNKRIIKMNIEDFDKILNSKEFDISNNNEKEKNKLLVK